VKDAYLTGQCEDNQEKRNDYYPEYEV
ncbi:uncharacterized protein METZ01_LOCUS176389, partial [marine metagenome]